LRDQNQLAAQVAGLEPQLQALAKIKKEAFVPPAKPTPIDPELAERYTQEDREMDEQRYQSSLLAWEQLHAERYRLWLIDHTRRQRALELDVERQAKVLKQLNPAVVQRSPNKPGTLQLNRQAIEKYSNCDPQAF
jgi:alkylated DNA repair dioxygenase AlkB